MIKSLISGIIGLVIGASFMWQRSQHIAAEALPTEGPKEYTFQDINYERAEREIFAEGIDHDLDLERAEIEGTFVNLPLASIYKVEPILDLIPDIIDEVCVAVAHYNADQNAEWGVTIRFKEKNIIHKLAEQHWGTDPDPSKYFSLVRIGDQSDFLKMGRFTFNRPDLHFPGVGARDMQVQFGDKDLGAMSMYLRRLSPTGDVLPCTDQIDMNLYNLNEPQWLRPNRNQQ